MRRTAIESPDPWTNPFFIGPPDRRPIDGNSHPGGREERHQQRAAINAWEDEGGSLAAPNARQGETPAHSRLNVRHGSRKAP
jgi:hypothetical protein